MTTTMTVPDVDLFGDDVLADPYPVLRELRRLGPAVHLPRHDVWFVGRYADVKACLADPEVFSAHRGVGMSVEFNRLSEGTAVLTTEGEHHRLLRQILMRDLNTPRLRAIQAQVDDDADRLVADLVAQGRFDAVNDLARVFPLSVVCAFLGLPLQDRDELLRLADAGINSFGPINGRTLRAFPQYHELLRYLSSVAVPPNLLPGGAGETFYAAVEAGEIDRATAAGLVSTYLVAGIDTTINSVSNALNLLGAHPEQWQRVREDPERMVPQALREVLRHDPPVQMMTRTVVRDTEIDGVAVAAGQRVLLSYASACRDERKWTDPDRFDVERDPRDHLALGHGVHNCVGAGLARLEAHAVLHAFARQVETFTCGPPRRHLNNVVRGLDSLPVEVSAAGPQAVAHGHEELDLAEVFVDHLPDSLASRALRPADARSEASLRAAWVRLGPPLTFDDFAAAARGALRRAYDTKYGTWAEDDDLRLVFGDAWVTPLREVLGGVRAGAKVLGVGINDGRELADLRLPAPVALDVVELSEVAIGLARERVGGLGQVSFHCSTLEDLELEPASYDLVFSFRTVNSSSVEPREFTARACMLTRRGGVTVLSVANGYRTHDQGPGYVRGMVDGATGALDRRRPHHIAGVVAAEMRRAGHEGVLEIAGPAEIFVVGRRGA